MVGDLVGYTALMAIDEERALGMVRRMRVIVPPLVREHGGRWIKDVGDGFLASFDSAVTAVECAVAIQRALGQDEERLRIGIHLGDVIFTDSDVFGDGVNIAARLELLAPPGGICISGQVHEFVRNQAGIRTVRMGETSLGVEGYALAGEGMVLPDRQETRAARAHASEKSTFVGGQRLRASMLSIVALALAAAAGALAAYAALGGGGDVGPAIGGDVGSAVAAPTAASVMGDRRFVTSESEAAVAHFQRGLAAAAALDWPVAEASAALAVEVDHTFASAHLLLAVAREALGRADGPDGGSALATARVSAELLPPGPERDLVMGAARRAAGACLEADAALQAAEDAAPEWYGAHLDWELTSRADALRCAGRLDEARAHLADHTAGDDPAALAAIVAHLLAVDGDIVAARRAARRAERAGEAIRPDVVLFDAVEHLANDDLEAGRERLEDVLDASGAGGAVPGSRGRRISDTSVRARLLLATLELRAGEPEASARQLDLAAAEARAADLPAWRAEAHLQRAALEGSKSGAGEERRALAEVEPLHPGPDGDRLRLRRFLLDARAGEPVTDEAADVLDALRDRTEAKAHAALLDGAQRLGAGDARGAIEHLVAALEMGSITVRAGAPSAWRPSIAEALLAEAYSAAGDSDAALEVRRRLASRSAQVAHAGSIIETRIWLEARRAVEEAGGGR